MDSQKEDAIRQLRLMIGSLSSMYRVHDYLVEHPDYIPTYVEQLSELLDKDIMDTLLADDGRVFANIFMNLSFPVSYKHNTVIYLTSTDISPIS